MPCKSSSSRLYNFPQMTGLSFYPINARSFSIVQCKLLHAHINQIWLNLFAEIIYGHIVFAIAV